MNTDQNSWLKWLLPMTAVIGLIPLQLPMHTAGLFMTVWESEFGWTRSQFGIALSIYTVSLMLVSPGVGWLVDRFGARRPIIVSMLLLAPAFLLVSQLQQPVWMLYAIFALFPVVGGATNAISFNRAIVQRFNSHVGIALAVAQCGAAAAVLISPAIVYYLLETTDWRHAWMILACIPLLLAPIIWLGFEGAQRGVKAAGGIISETVAVSGMEFDKALRSSKLWLFALSFALFFFAVGGAVGQFVPIMRDIGISTGQAVTYQGMLGVAILFGRLGTGYLLDHFFASYVYLAVALLGAAGFLILGQGIDSLIAIGVICVGVAIGAEVDLASYMASRYFGTRHYGKIFSVIYTALICGGIFSHLFYGLMADAMGGYHNSLLVAAAVLILAALLVIRAGLYPRFEMEKAGG